MQSTTPEKGMRQTKPCYLILFTIVVTMAGCGGGSDSPILSTSAPTLAPTLTPTPTQTAMPTQTATSTPTPSPSPTASRALQATLWVANSNATITSYSENAGSDATPNVLISNPFAATFVNPPGAGAFDSGGNLWVPNGGGNTIVEFSAAQVEQGGTPNPIVTIANPGGQTFISQPSALAFDSTGNLWVVNSGKPNCIFGNPNSCHPTIIEYTAQQLTSNPQNQPFTFAPAAIISNPPGPAALSDPRGIAFDRAGNLWVSNFSGGTNQSPGQLVAYSPGQQVTGSPTPMVILSNPAQGLPVLVFPRGIAFDKNGNLWVTSVTVSGWNLVQYSKAQLAVSGSPIPAVTIAHQSNSGANGVAFDSKGNMWVAENINVLEFATTDITQSGSPTPLVTISNPNFVAAFLNSSLSLLFDSAGELVVINNAFLNPIVEYSAAQIAASGSPSPESVLNNPSADPRLGVPAGLAFDSSGRLWESVNRANSSPALGAVLAFNQADLQQTGSPTPAIFISDPTHPTPSGIAFDSKGNLWVANFSSGEFGLVQSLVQYSAASIASGAPEPTVIITTSSSSVSFATTRIAFDPQGNLWLVDVVGNSVVEYAASSLTSTGSPTPAAVIPSESNVLFFQSPLGLGFDNSANLWVGSSNTTLAPLVNNAVAVEFDGKNLSSSSSPIADISGPSSVLSDLQFDTVTGDMWIVGDNNRLLEYKASTLAGGGNISEADAAIAGPLSGLDNPTALAIQP